MEAIIVLAIIDNELNESIGTNNDIYLVSLQFLNKPVNEVLIELALKNLN